MNKSPDAFRTISEVSETLDIPAHVLRFWESKFAQIRPVKRGGGRRYYRPEDITLLRGIRELLYTDGMTIKGVQKIFAEGGPRQVSARGGGVGAASSATPEPPMAEPATDPSPELSAELSPERSAALAAAIRKLEGLEARLRAPVSLAPVDDGT